MTPDEMRLAYRAKCEYARKGHTIFSVDNGRIGDVFKTFTRNVTVNGEKVVLPAINAAKRWVRSQPTGSVFVAD
jgi:hypothetical protein